MNFLQLNRIKKIKNPYYNYIYNRFLKIIQSFFSNKKGAQKEHLHLGQIKL